MSGRLPSKIVKQAIAKTTRPYVPRGTALFLSGKVKVDVCFLAARLRLFSSTKQVRSRMDNVVAFGLTAAVSLAQTHCGADLEGNCFFRRVFYGRVKHGERALAKIVNGVNKATANRYVSAKGLAA